MTTDKLPAYDVWLAGIPISGLKKNMLLTAMGSAKAIFKASAEELNMTGMLRPKDIEKLTSERDATRRQTAQALHYMRQSSTMCITREDAAFPEALRHIYNPPVALFARGNIGLLSRDIKLAMVGSRKASPGGLKTAETFGRTFSEAGMTIVSGMADGIDAASAEGALSGIGSTIAVLGCGIDICYPAVNRPLYDEIGANGLLLSEFFFGQPPKKGHFPLRNRVISGLSDGVLVVEAGKKSGALITANHAAEQGKNVYAVPQDIHSRTGAGCNQLLKDGAKVVTEPQDVLEDYVARFPEQSETQEKDAAAKSAEIVQLSEAEQALFDIIAGGVNTVDGLVVKTGQPINELNATLMMLELKDLISVSFGEIALLG